MTLEYIRKRDNSVINFDRSRIESAIEKACIKVGHKDTIFIPEITTAIIIELQDKYYNTGAQDMPTVENVQDVVEKKLVEADLYNVAKEYILYRASQIEKRKDIVDEKVEKHELSLLKRSGETQAFEIAKVRKVLELAANNHPNIDVEKLLKELRNNIFDGISSTDISKALVMASKSFIENDPQYTYVTSKLFLMNYYKELMGSADMKNNSFDEVYRKKFIENIGYLVETEHLAEDMLDFDLEKIAAAIKPERDNELTYLAIQNLYDRYFIHHDKVRKELPQAFWMRVAMGLARLEEDKEKWAIEFYNNFSQLHFVSSTPTLFNSGTRHSQLSSCYLSTVDDSLTNIFKVISDDAQLSKWAGGLGNDWTNIRAMGSKIKGTNGESQGVIPFLKIANDTAVAVNQGGKRKGALCCYLETWHLDVESFLELRKNTGDERRRTHDMNTANWIPDLFMKRLQEDKDWTLFSPSDVPDLHHIYGAEFERAYESYEEQTKTGELKLYKRVKAKDLWRKMISMLFETGHPWITFKDPSNIRSPQDHVGVVHNSNLCTEITLNTSKEETAVCNLGSVNLSRHIAEDGSLDREKIAKTVTTGMRMLDNVVDINFYPIEEAKRSNTRHRPVGLGMMGLADCLFKLDIAFDSDEGVAFNDEVMELVSYYAILGSSHIAKERGTYESYEGSKWSRGIFPIDTIAMLEKERGENVMTDKKERLDWTEVREHVAKYGMRNSNTMAIAPTATISNIAGCFPCIEPIYKNLYVKSNLSGEFTIINQYLVADLKAIGLWTPEMVSKIKYYDGSIQAIDEIPEKIRAKYKEVFEISPEWVIKAAGARGKWIDQSQSVNIFIKGASGKLISDTYMMSWKYGMKTTYYLRTLGATSVEKSTQGIATQSQTVAPTPKADADKATMCSILNGPDCESCQ